MVNDADRRAAAAVLWEHEKGGLNWATTAHRKERVESGLWDDDPTVQAFAAHRLAHQSSERDGAAEAAIVYSEQALADLCIDFLESRADEWMADTSVERMFNAIASVFEKYAPQDIMDLFRRNLNAIGHQCYVEGALRVWEEISDQQRALGNPLPLNPELALPDNRQHAGSVGRIE